MNLNKLTKSYIKDVAHMVKKWHLSSLSVELENDYEVIFLRNKGSIHIHVNDEYGEYVTMFLQKELKDLLEEFEKSPFYMAKIKV